MVCRCQKTMHMINFYTISTVRALPSDIKSWKSKLWNWTTVLDVYKQMENFTGSSRFESYHGYQGPVQTGIIYLQLKLS